jgi:hypothetical protein
VAAVGIADVAGGGADFRGWVFVFAAAGKQVMEKQAVAFLKKRLRVGGSAKNFCSWGGAVDNARALRTKVFWFFFSKKNRLLFLEP